MKALYAVREVDSAGRLTRQHITELMGPVSTVHEATPLHIAVAEMVRQGKRHLAAVDSDGKCVGVLGDRAAIGCWAGAGKPLMRQTVRGALSPAVISSNAVVGQVARLMLDTGATAVAVTDPQGLPVGMITGADLVALLSRDPDQQVRR